MTDQLIKPWAHENHENILDSLYVPPYIEEMAWQVVQYYDFNVDQMTIMATKDQKGGAIWKIDTDKGPFSLKLLHRRPTRSIFSLGAQNYLVHEKNARVPAIYKTKENQDYVEMGGKLWFVAEWIESLQPLPEDLEGTKQLCYALGEFHQLTKGYIPPKGAEHASRLHRWPRTYERMEKKMNWFRDIAAVYNDLPASSTILSVIDMYQEQIRQALTQLENSAYNEIVARGTQDTGLVHQDYGWSNAQMGEDGVWIIDLDGVSFDITIRDLRKLIVDRMHFLENWDITWVREMIQAYHQANPISDEIYDILLIDLALPNMFYKDIKDILYSPETFMTPALEQELQLIIELENQKWPVLEELRKNWKGGLSE